MLPPSRGRLNAGAFAPSAKGKAGTDRTADSAGFSAGSLLGVRCLTAGFSAEGLLGAGCPTAGFAAVFDILMERGADFPALEDFNFFDGDFEAFAVALPVGLFFVLLVLVAVVARVFEGAVFNDLADRARIAFPAAGLEDFLRVFLDIRLPFVAFRRSIIGVLKRGARWISSVAGQVGFVPGLCSKGIRHATRPLAWLQPSDKRGVGRSASTFGVSTLLRRRESRDYLQI